MADALAETQEGVLQELESLVGQEMKAVTYKWLARHFNLHVCLAKRLLQTFAEQHAGKVHVTHLIAGTTKAGLEQLLQVVPDSLVAEVKAGLDPVTCDHIYSVAPLPQADTAAADQQDQQQQQQHVPEAADPVAAAPRHGASLVQAERQQGLEAVAAALADGTLPPAAFSRAACSAVRGLHPVGAPMRRATQAPEPGAGARQPLTALSGAINEQQQQQAKAAPAPMLAPAVPAQAAAPTHAPHALEAAASGSAGGQPSAISKLFMRGGASGKQKQQQQAALTTEQPAAKPAAPAGGGTAPRALEPPATAKAPAQQQQGGSGGVHAQPQAADRQPLAPQPPHAEDVQAEEEEEEQGLVGKRSHKRGRQVLVDDDDEDEAKEAQVAPPPKTAKPAPAPEAAEAAPRGGGDACTHVPASPKGDKPGGVGAGRKRQAEASTADEVAPAVKGGKTSKVSAAAAAPGAASKKQQQLPASTAPRAKAAKQSVAPPEIVQLSLDNSAPMDTDVPGKDCSKAAKGSQEQQKQHKEPHKHKEHKPVPAVFAPRPLAASAGVAGGAKHKRKEMQTVINEKGEEVTMEVDVEVDDGVEEPVPAPAAAPPVSSKPSSGAPAKKGAGAASSPVAQGAGKGSGKAQGKTAAGQRSIQSFFSKKPGAL